MSSKYSESGVDIDAAGRALEKIKGFVRKTWNSAVLSDVGNFGGLFELSSVYKNPVLVSSVDGVGTKLRLAFMSGRHDTVGEDLVNHCVNDILVQGAEPLFFLDYFGCGKLDPDVMADVVKGLARGCKSNGCALIGGETAEMPGFYAEGEYDIAGCIVGVVERDNLIDGKRIEPGDAVLAFPSGGLHTNGYSLARKIIFGDLAMGIDDEVPGTGRKAVDILMDVHRSYLPEIRSLRGHVDIRGLAHITGGGLLDNVPRVLPDGCCVEIDTSAWDVPGIFRFLEKEGRVDRSEMYRVFNMGIGMVMILPRDDETRLDPSGCRWRPFRIGKVTEGEKTVILA